jgi:hypothetical protein
MADPAVPSSVDREAKARKRTSASPALDALKRTIEETRGYHTQFERDAQKEQQRRDEHYVASDGGRPRNVREAGVGRPLLGTEVQKRLLMLNPALIFEDSTYPGRICIKRWISDPVLGETLHYVTAMERGLMPEFSILNFVEEEYFDAQTQAIPEGTGLIKTRLKIDERNPETRGWRTVILRLIKERLISREGAERLFGLPSHDSRNWQGNLQ